MLNHHTDLKLARERHKELLKEAELYRLFQKPEAHPFRRKFLTVLVVVTLIALVAIPVAIVALGGG